MPFFRLKQRKRYKKRFCIEITAIFTSLYFLKMNIYVSNIPFKMTDEQLGELFAVHGEVISAKIIMDKFTKRSRGFGFVEMPDDAAQAAIADLNGKDVMGLELRVNEARPRTEDSGGGYGGGNRNRGGGGGGYKRDY